jgi:hypothetical protein
MDQIIPQVLLLLITFLSNVSFRLLHVYSVYTVQEVLTLNIEVALRVFLFDIQMFQFSANRQTILTKCSVIFPPEFLGNDGPRYVPSKLVAIYQSETAHLTLRLLST